jgi:DNA-binding response OmpR family regulator
MKKILIVEDDQSIAKGLAIRLASAGYEVTVAPDALSGVAAALKCQPDLALLDIYMKKTLIVEDDSNSVKDMAIRLKSAGYEVTPAPGARAGVASANIQPERARIDISMPAGNGFTAADRIRDLGATAIPIIFLTAGREPGLRQRALKLGAAGFFEKPYDDNELLAAIKRTLSEKTSSPNIKEHENVEKYEENPNRRR